MSAEPFCVVAPNISTERLLARLMRMKIVAMIEPEGQMCDAGFGIRS